jgi:hypothetical protein
MPGVRDGQLVPQVSRNRIGGNSRAMGIVKPRSLRRIEALRIQFEVIVRGTLLVLNLQARTGARTRATLGFPSVGSVRVGSTCRRRSTRQIAPGSDCCSILCQPCIHKPDDFVECVRLESLLAGNASDQAVDAFDVFGATKQGPCCG